MARDGSKSPDRNGSHRRRVSRSPVRRDKEVSKANRVLVRSRSRSRERNRRSRSRSEERARRSRSRSKDRNSSGKLRERRSDGRSRSRERARESRSRSRDRIRRNRSRSRDRNIRIRSKDRSIRSRSRERNVRSQSKDRSIRSRSRERNIRSQSKDRSIRSRSRERNLRSQSKERRKTKRSKSPAKEREPERSRGRDHDEKTTKRDRESRIEVKVTEKTTAENGRNMNEVKEGEASPTGEQKVVTKNSLEAVSLYSSKDLQGSTESGALSNGKKLEPLSLEEILKRKKEEAAQLAKPVFMTKEQRAALAMKKREEEVAEQRKRLDDQRKALMEAQQNSRDAGRQQDRDRDRDRDRGRDRNRDRRDRDRDRERDDRVREKDTKSREEIAAEKAREKELEAIKEQYLGLKKPKKRVIKPSEKFRFSFDWENSEDTSRDMNPIYQNPHEAQLLFGRGFRAGVDRREQKKLAAKNESDLRAQIREKTGTEETREERVAAREKEDAANMYDTFDMRVDRHWSEKKLEDMTDRDWRIFREDFSISYKGARIPKPLRNWAESNLSKELQKAVEKAGYTKPSPIQMAAIPLGLQQRDVIGIAETGSGKTAAFVLPMLTYISRLPPMTEENEAEGPYAVVMAPTRELAQQIEEETVKFAQYMDLRVVSIVGGQPIEEQGFKLRQGCEIVIATPGRLIDCLERRYAVLNQCNYVVLDEADRMIDMGFEPQVTGVLEAMPSSNLKPENEDEELDAQKVYRTTYMFSATMPPTVERLARKFLRNPVVVTIGTAGKATDLITQNVYMVKESEKLDRTCRILSDLGDKPAIVFVNTKKSADGLAKQLTKHGYKVTTLHGGKTQEQREVSLEGFRTKAFSVLVATDVAGRGIDIPDVAHVVNYDMPGNIEMYTHRIGRTGRAGKTGAATTFLTLYDQDVFYDLKQMLTQNGSIVPPELARHEAAKFKPGSIPDRPSRKNEQLFTH